MTISVDRRQVLAYRAFAQELHRPGASASDLAVLDLGVQDTPAGAAAHALANRLRDPSTEPAGAAGLVTTWSVRGAPHVHRSEDLVPLSRALWPWTDADALARLDTSSAPVRSSGMAPREALRFVAERIAEIVTAPMTKGDVSTALTPHLPEAMTVDCRRCEATHVVETLFRSAVLPAGITFQPGRRTVTFERVPGWPGVPEDTEGSERQVLAYLHLLGPATTAEVAAFLGTRASELRPRWPAGLAEVVVDGRRRWLPQEDVDTLLTAPDPPAVRLLAPSDPWLQARDRDLVVPDADQRKVLWPILGRPGALLLGGEVAGSWSARKKGRRLEVNVQPFGRLPRAGRRGIEEEATLAAQVRGAADAAVSIE